jgi:hypothetical protein
MIVQVRGVQRCACACTKSVFSIRNAWRGRSLPHCARLTCSDATRCFTLRVCRRVDGVRAQAEHIWRAAGERKHSVGAVLSQTRALADQLVELCAATPSVHDAAAISISRCVCGMRARACVCDVVRLERSGVLPCLPALMQAIKKAPDVLLPLDRVLNVRMPPGALCVCDALCVRVRVIAHTRADHAPLPDDDAALHAFVEGNNAPRFATLLDKVRREGIVVIAVQLRARAQGGCALVAAEAEAHRSAGAHG